MKHWLPKLMALFLVNSTFLPETQANELAVGGLAKRQATVTVDSVPARAFNYLTRADVLKMRQARVAAYPYLLAEPYVPMSQIFDRVEDGKPWWGTYGATIFQRGLHSIEGPSRESSYILNPYRLVCVEPTLGGIWNLHALHRDDLQNPEFPADWVCGPVTYDPRKRIAQVTCYVSQFQKKLDSAPWQSKLRNPIKILSFSMVAYNARDFGYCFMQLSPGESTNLQRWPDFEPVQITQMLHCGGSCGYPGGCNNMSPAIPKLDYNTIKALPARAYIKLWQEEPAKRDQAPDMVFVINFI